MAETAGNATTMEEIAPAVATETATLVSPQVDIPNFLNGIETTRIENFIT